MANQPLAKTGRARASSGLPTSAAARAAITTGSLFLSVLLRATAMPDDKITAAEIDAVSNESRALIDASAIAHSRLQKLTAKGTSTSRGFRGPPGDLAFYAARMVRTATEVVGMTSAKVRRAAAAIFSVAISSRRRT